MICSGERPWDMDRSVPSALNQVAHTVAAARQRCKLVDAMAMGNGQWAKGKGQKVPGSGGRRTRPCAGPRTGTVLPPCRR